MQGKERNCWLGCHNTQPRWRRFSPIYERSACKFYHNLQRSGARYKVSASSKLLWSGTILNSSNRNRCIGLHTRTYGTSHRTQKRIFRIKLAINARLSALFPFGWIFLSRLRLVWRLFCGLCHFTEWTEHNSEWSMFILCLFASDCSSTRPWPRFTSSPVRGIVQRNDFRMNRSSRIAHSGSMWCFLCC